MDGQIINITTRDKRNHDVLMCLNVLGDLHRTSLGQVLLLERKKEDLRGSVTQSTMRSMSVLCIQASTTA